MPFFKAIAALFFTIPLLLGIEAFATDADWDDYVLIAYALTPAEEAQYARDGAVSGFWSTWEEKRLDKVHLIPSKHVTFRPDPEGFIAGDDDAQMVVFAAWGEQGLYLLFDVRDDDFAGYILESGVSEYYGSVGDRKAEQWNDAVELRLDQYSSEDLVDNYETLFPTDIPEEEQTGNSLTVAQYGLRFGGDVPDPEVEILRRNPSYDPASADSTSWQESLAYLWQRWGVADVAPAHGVFIDVIMTDANRRYQEWRLAWNQIGLEGTFTKPAAGNKIACIVGYNDTDIGYTATWEDAMRWRNADSYWRNPKEKGLNAWGDIEFGPSLADAQGAPEIGVISSFRPRLARVAPTIRTSYSINGRKLDRFSLASGLILTRVRTTIGHNAVRSAVRH